MPTKHKLNGIFLNCLSNESCHYTLTQCGSPLRRFSCEHRLLKFCKKMQKWRQSRQFVSGVNLWVLLRFYLQDTHYADSCSKSKTNTLLNVEIVVVFLLLLWAGVCRLGMMWKKLFFYQKEIILKREMFIMASHKNKVVCCNWCNQNIIKKVSKFFWWWIVWK